MSQFTNRHGKKVQVSDDEVVVEKLPPVKTSNTDTYAPRTTKKKRLPKVRLSKRAWVTVFVMLVLVSVALLVTADSVKRDYESQTAAMKRTIAERGKQSTSTETAPDKTIAALRASLNARADCKVQGIDVVSWYGPAKDARQDCQETADRYKKLQLALDDMAAMATYTTEMNTILKVPLSAPGSGEFGIISEYAVTWEEALASLKNITPPEILSSQHAGLIAKVNAVSEAWNGLNAANNDRNATAFKTAETTLSDKYTELRTSADSMQTIIISTQTSINRYVSELSE